MKEMFKYPLVLALAILVGLMTITKIRYKNVVWPEEVKPSIYISPTSEPSVAPRINEEYPLWELLPYEGKNFIVERYTSPGVLSVKIDKGVDKKKIDEEIYKWMEENKVATESQKIEYKTQETK
ncbi:MAG: hypothetical protein AAGU06_02955 [Candidatus Shapirobacteria bacterium]